jgi:hypothetical protein
MASSVCAQPGCPTILPPGGGVRGYCERHAPEAIVEALEQMRTVLEVQGQHIARMELSIGAIEDCVKALARRG